MASGEGRAERLEVAPDGERVEVKWVSADGTLSFSCTPERARELAAELVRAAGEAEAAVSSEPVTVAAGELRRGDVRDGERPMTVDGLRIDGATVHVTWKSGAGRTWTQVYDADAGIALRRRG